MQTHLVNLSNPTLRLDLTSKLTSKITQAILAYSEITDNGRLIKGVDMSHLLNEVLPDIIDGTLRKY